MDIYNLQAEVWQIAEEKGWHKKEVPFGEFIAQVHAELSEAFEIYREHGDSVINRVRIEQEALEHYSGGVMDLVVPISKMPVGIPVELADAVMRILDFCQTNGIDIERAIHIKKEYNKTREHRHGKVI